MNFRSYFLSSLFLIGLHNIVQLQAQTVRVGIDGVKFASIGGNKVVLAGNGEAFHTGIGLQGGILQFYVPDASANISFRRTTATGLGFDPSILHITGSGNVGINTATPGARLDVAGHVVLRTNGESAGMWLGNSLQTANNYFIGVRDDNSAGIYWNGSNPSWRIWTHTNTGALGINNGVGLPGAMLVSAGAAGATNWQVQNDLAFYNLSNEVKEDNFYTLTDASPIAQPLGLSLTQTYPSTTRCVIAANVQATSISCAFCGPTELQINVLIDGAVQKSFRHYVDNGSTNTLTGLAYAQLAPGNHTIALQIQKLSGPTLSLTPEANRKSSLLVVAAPQN
jgi:hypothetical protein